MDRSLICVTNIVPRIFFPFFLFFKNVEYPSGMTLIEWTLYVVTKKKKKQKEIYFY